MLIITSYAALTDNREGRREKETDLWKTEEQMRRMTVTEKYLLVSNLWFTHHSIHAYT